MSYDIVYNRQFLKAGDKFVPLVLIGCNNLWEPDSKRRVRNWNSLMKGCNSIPLMTEEELIANAEARTGGEYQEHFKYNSKWVDDEAWMSFCKNGIRGACTLEYLQARSRYPEDVHLNCRLSVWYTDESLPKDQYRQKSKSELITTVRSTDDLLAFFEKAKERIESKAANENSIFVCTEFPSEKIIDYPAAPKKKRTPPARLADFWTVVIKREAGGSYMIEKLTARSLRFAYSANTAKQFKTQEAAEKWVDEKSIKSRFDGIEEIEFMHIDFPAA